MDERNTSLTAKHARNPFQLDGLRTFVTGASRGIGAAIARAFADAGSDLALGARTRNALISTHDYVQNSGRKVFLVPGDFNDPHAAESSIDQAADLLGGLDAVVHVAGVIPSDAAGAPKITPFHSTTHEEWATVARINLDATASLCRAAFAHLCRGTRRHARNGSVRSDKGCPAVSRKNFGRGMGPFWSEGQRDRSRLGGYRHDLVCHKLAPCFRLAHGPRTPRRLDEA